MGKDGGWGVGGEVRPGAGGPHPGAQRSRDTRVPLQTAPFILIYHIFRSKLILAFNNLFRTEKLLGSLFMW